MSTQNEAYGRRTRRVLLGGLAWLLCACAPNAAADPTDRQAPQTPRAQPGTPAGSAGSGGMVTPTPSPEEPSAQAARAAALRAAAMHLAIPEAQVRVERLEAREWSDASLGCPQPGRMYAQVITPGYVVVVAGGGKRLEYHADSQGRAVLCREL